MIPKYDIVILGAGLIGSSIAYHLSQAAKKENHRFGVAVLDVDLEGRYSASELNAGGARAEWWQSVNIELSKATLSFLAKDPVQFGFRQKGYLWLYDAKGWQDYLLHKDLYRRHELSIEELSPKEVQRRAPFLDRLQGVYAATFSPSDGLFNPNLLKQFFRSEAKKENVQFMDGARVIEIETSAKNVGVQYQDLMSERGHPNPDHVFQILSQKNGTFHYPTKKINTDMLINAAGVWSSALASLYGHEVVCLPVRRQISLFDCQGLDLSPYGMIVDTSGLYVHAEGDHILGGFAIPQEPVGFNFQYDGDLFFEEQIWPRFYERVSRAQALKHLKGWAGLYSVTKDRSGILGQVKGEPRIYEAHSFTGRGAMQSYGVGLAVSELVLKGKAICMDITSLHPDRFRKPHGKLLYEGMHI
ncbi:MAG: FAD-binding oxidoreductase [Deltaproteobacteria bacterium]|nr:FAD-binding oxidoreductase [Deltaproteobacteria bacterium]